MIPTKDSLGLTLTPMGGVIEDPPFIIVYAKPGFGKSLSFCTSFAGTTDGQGALFLTTAPTVLRPYASWCAMNREIVEAAKLRTLLKPNPWWTPEKQKNGEPAYLNEARSWAEGGMAVKEIPAFLPDGKTQVDNCEIVREILERFCNARQKSACPYNGFILDEGSEFGDRWLSAINARFMKEIAHNPYKRWDLVDSWFNWLKAVPRAAGCFLGMACHVEDPKYFGEADKQPMKVGQLKSEGGPSMPGARVREALCAAADVVLRGVIRPKGGDTLLGNGEIERVWMTEVDPIWFAKIRAFGIDREEKRSLRRILLAAGYRLH